MSKQEILDREARFMRPAAFAAILGVLLAIGSQIGLSRTFGGDEDHEFLREFADKSGSALPYHLLAAFGFILVGAAVVYLFAATHARSENVRAGLAVVLVAGSTFLAGAEIAKYVGADQAASDFTSERIAPENEEDRAEELLEDSTALNVATGLQLGGYLGLGLGSLYTALWAMRTGLLTRFWGTFGMATGITLLIFGFFFFPLWILYLGFLFAGWVPGGRPPAWAAREAIPWPKPAEEKGEAAAPGPAGGDAVEGSGRELVEPPLPDDETQGQRRKKRKRRG